MGDEFWKKDFKNLQNAQGGSEDEYDDMYNEDEKIGFEEQKFNILMDDAEQLYMEIKHMVRTASLPIFDRLTVADLFQFLYPDLKESPEV